MSSALPCVPVLLVVMFLCTCHGSDVTGTNDDSWVETGLDSLEDVEGKGCTAIEKQCHDSVTEEAGKNKKLQGVNREALVMLAKIYKLKQGTWKAPNLADFTAKGPGPHRRLLGADHNSGNKKTTNLHQDSAASSTSTRETDVDVDAEPPADDKNDKAAAIIARLKGDIADERKHEAAATKAAKAADAELLRFKQRTEQEFADRKAKESDMAKLQHKFEKQRLAAAKHASEEQQKEEEEEEEANKKEASHAKAAAAKDHAKMTKVNQNPPAISKLLHMANNGQGAEHPSNLLLGHNMDHLGDLEQKLGDHHHDFVQQLSLVETGEEVTPPTPNAVAPPTGAAAPPAVANMAAPPAVANMAAPPAVANMAAPPTGPAVAPPATAMAPPAAPMAPPVAPVAPPANAGGAGGPVKGVEMSADADTDTDADLDTDADADTNTDVNADINAGTDAQTQAMLQNQAIAVEAATLEMMDTGDLLHGMKQVSLADLKDALSEAHKKTESIKAGLGVISSALVQVETKIKQCMKKKSQGRCS
jgi:hypothetical protein